MVHLKNSSDLDVGRRPKLKSDELFDANPIVIEFISLLCEIAGDNWRSYWGHDPSLRGFRADRAAGRTRRREIQLDYALRDYALLAVSAGLANQIVLITV